MARVLHTRSVPHLEFVFDEGLSESIRMQNLIRELNAPKDGDGEAAGDASPDDSQPAGDDPKPDAPKSDDPKSDDPKSDDA